MDKTIKRQLAELADEEYRRFSAALIPNIDNVLGVRLPQLRKLAKQLVKEDWRAYVRQEGNDSFEETMLEGMIIGYIKTDTEEWLRLIADFVPKIDNWSVCDSFCTGLKVAASDKERVWAFLQPYLASPREYDIRFGVVMLLMYYIEPDYIVEVLRLLDGIRHDGYYAKMAVAWALSICFVKLPGPTLAYLEGRPALDDFTYNKALQKMTESLQVDPQTKQRLRAMKRPGPGRR
ncbi:DNA alkylation repair protein [Paenibacillus hodogayensis]|uniref:DNA alkylation repair protein n=1 Tax=Paenibacillus hodogayensis TaxID=279208 RepID=A0ABV5W4Y3_9BACL